MSKIYTMNQDFSTIDKKVLMKVIDGLNNPLRTKEESYTEHVKKYNE